MLMVRIWVINAVDAVGAVRSVYSPFFVHFVYFVHLVDCFAAVDTFDNIVVYVKPEFSNDFGLFLLRLILVTIVLYYMALVVNLMLLVRLFMFLRLFDCFAFAVLDYNTFISRSNEIITIINHSIFYIRYIVLLRTLTKNWWLKKRGNNLNLGV